MKCVYRWAGGVRYVITKFSLMDSLPNFVTNGALLRMLCTHESSAIISLTCISSKTNNFFRPGGGGGGGGSPLYTTCRLYRYVPCQKVFFFWFEMGYQFRPFWSETGYGLCLLVLNWVCFLEELATSSSFGDKTISLLMFIPTTVYVP